MSYSLTFGSYTFPRGFQVTNVPSGRVAPLVKLPRAHGSRVVTPAYLDGKKLNVKGLLSASGIGGGSIRTALDALKAALALGPQNFTTDSDRYYRNCVLEAFGESYDAGGWGKNAPVSFDLVTGDPYSYDSTVNTTDLVASAGVVAVGGNAPAAPKISLTAGSTATANWTITNTTTGEVCTINGAVVNGDVVVIDSLLETVTIAGVDKISLFDGLWLSLAVGNNTVTATNSGGATIGAKSCQWNNRYF